MWYLILHPTQDELSRLMLAYRRDEQTRFRRAMVRHFPNIFAAPTEDSDFENVARSIANRRGLLIPRGARPMIQFAHDGSKTTLRWWVEEREGSSRESEVS